MRFQGAVITEQGVTFAIAIVRPSALRSTATRDQVLAEFSALFGLPTLLMAQDSSGTPTYYGRTDLTKFMAAVPIEAVTWSEYQLSQ